MKGVGRARCLEKIHIFIVLMGNNPRCLFVLNIGPEGIFIKTDFLLI